MKILHLVQMVYNYADEFVIPIGSAFLEEADSSMQDYFSHIVRRNLPKADLPTLIEGIALDTGIRK